MNTITKVLAALAFAAPVMTHAATVTVTIEDPGVQEADLAGIGATGSAVETFDTATLGSFSNYSSALGTYSAGEVKNANRFGGADETQFLFSQNSPGSTLTLTTAATYFGFWWSAGSVNNQVDLMAGGASLFSFDTDDVLNFLANNASNASAYNGNPNPGFQGQNGNQPYVFVNMFSDMAFDAVVFSGPNFESDNHTIATSFTDTTGTDINPVPVPASLPLLLASLGVTGWVARRRRS